MPLGNYLQPGMPPESQRPSPEEQARLHTGWRSWLDNPDHRAMMLQAGVALLQPIAPGQTLVGHIGSAVGQAGQTAATREQMRAQMAQRQFEDALRLGAFEQSGEQFEFQKTSADRDYGLAVEAGERDAERIGIADYSAKHPAAAYRAPAGRHTQQSLSDIADSAAKEWENNYGWMKPDDSQYVPQETYVRQAVKDRSMLTDDQIKSIISGNDPFDVPLPFQPATPSKGAPGATPPATMTSPTPAAKDVPTSWLSTTPAVPTKLSRAKGATGDVLVDQEGGVVAGPRVAPEPPNQNDARIRQAAGVAERVPEPPPLQPGEKATANLYLLAMPGQWAQVKAMIASPDPKIKARGILMKNDILRGISDPQNLENR